MRKSKDEAAHTRARIVETASRLFRRKGIATTGLDELMATAGLTRGGFYRHFGSKDQLIEEACVSAAESRIQSIAEAVKKGESGEGLRILVNFYLSSKQRDRPSTSCPLAMLGSELARCEPAVRRVASDAYLKLVAIFARELGDPNESQNREKALGAIAALVGALTLSRIVMDPILSEDILEATRKLVVMSSRLDLHGKN